MKEKMNAGLSELNRRLDQEIQIVNDDFSKKSDLLYKALKAGKITEDEYKSNVHKVKILRDSEINKLRQQYNIEKNEFLTGIINDAVDKLKQQCDIKKDQIYKQKDKFEKELREVELEIDNINKEYKDDIGSVEEKSKEKVKEMKANLKENEVKKIGEECIIIPPEKRELLIKYITMGAIPTRIINNFEIARANETIEEIRLEKILKEENESKISLGKEYESKINDKKKQSKELKEKISELEENLEEINEEYKESKAKLEVYIPNDINKDFER